MATRAGERSIISRFAIDRTVSYERGFLFRMPRVTSRSSARRRKIMRTNGVMRTRWRHGSLAMLARYTCPETREYPGAIGVDALRSLARYYIVSSIHQRGP